MIRKQSFIKSLFIALFEKRKEDRELKQLERRVAKATKQYFKQTYKETRKSDG